LPTARRLEASGAAASPRFFSQLVGHLVTWRQRARSRHLLRRLDDRMLRDVGLSRSDVERECAKHFWQHRS
jgi:uncharacterized protein YjiS (DUF1127 family)